MTRASFAFTLAVTAALAGACASKPDVCSDLTARLKACDVPVASDMACTDNGVTEAIAARLDDEGCDGLAADASSAVDARVCDFGGFPCPPPPTPAPTASAPKYPLVFVSGIDGTPTFDWNPRILSALATSGIETHHVQVSPWASTSERAADLWGAVDGLLARGGATKVNLVCYAVGGIDCRFLASPRGLFANDAATYARVNTALASVTTISTPHRGTGVADAALAALQSGITTDLLDALTGATAVPPSDGQLADTLRALTVEAMADFDTRVPDGTGIYYQSFAGVSDVLGKSSAAADADALSACGGTFFRHDGTHDAMNEVLWVTAPFAGTPSDGMIQVASAKHGNFRGCIPADHYDVIGQIGHVTRDVETGFDDTFFYAFIASDLAGRGL